MVLNNIGHRNFMQPMGRLACTQSALIFFLLNVRGGGEEEDFFIFSLFQHVPFKFPMGSPMVFPTAPCFNPICFAQSPANQIGSLQKKRKKKRSKVRLVRHPQETCL